MTFIFLWSHHLLLFIVKSDRNDHVHVHVLLFLKIFFCSLVSSFCPIVSLFLFLHLCSVGLLPSTLCFFSSASAWNQAIDLFAAVAVLHRKVDAHLKVCTRTVFQTFNSTSCDSSDVNALRLIAPAQDLKATRHSTLQRVSSGTVASSTHQDL